MQLADLISCLVVKEVRGNSAVEVKGLAYHSRGVQEGFLFAAIRGLRDHGQRFIPEALSRGARALLVEEPFPNSPAAQVIVPDVREALARLSAAFYGDPSSALTLIGITGTNGKTTTSYLIESILREGGWNPGVLGTINYRFAGQKIPAPTTTPESLDLQKNLQAMREEGVTHAILEVSSHALDLQRVRGCDFDVALFTNLTRDHLDYHQTMENYFQAKKLLFTQCLAESKKRKHYSVINIDDRKGEELARETCGLLFRYGVDHRGEVWPERVAESAEGLRARVVTPRGALPLASPLIGQHNLYNILAAVSVGEILNVTQEHIIAGVGKLDRVPGRLERVSGEDGPAVFVDYAHTPDALDRALRTLKRIRSGRTIVVFGCGGDRDRGKRAPMGRVAATGSDLAIVTSDNPRSEDPLQIIAEVEKGLAETGRPKWSGDEVRCGRAGSGYTMIPDRQEAIRLAIAVAHSGDVVLIAGKGHEDYQILREKKIHFNDREEAVFALTEKKERKDR